MSKFQVLFLLKPLWHYWRFKIFQASLEGLDSFCFTTWQTASWDFILKSILKKLWLTKYTMHDFSNIQYFLCLWIPRSWVKCTRALVMELIWFYVCNWYLWFSAWKLWAEKKCILTSYSCPWPFRTRIYFNLSFI